MPNYPIPQKERNEINRKLGVKASMDELQSLFALTYALWLVCEKDSEIQYSVEKTIDSTIIIEIIPDLFEKVYDFFHDEIKSVSDKNSFLSAINNNPLFIKQLEPLKVCFELFWKIGKIFFVDINANNAERKGKERYNKKINYSINIDILDIALSNNDGTVNNEIKLLLTKWIVDNHNTDIKLDSVEKKIALKIFKLLSIITEDTFFKIRKIEGDDLAFQQEGIYEAFLNSSYEPVDIKGKESVGPFRILISSVKNKLHPYINFKDNKFIFDENKIKDEFEHYSKRVTNYLDLIERKINISISVPIKSEYKSDEETPKNLILYGSPGTGKSRALKIKLKTLKVSDQNRFYTTFHPDYDYSDFIGKYKPISFDSKIDVDNEKQEPKSIIKYIFEPGIFLKAYIQAIQTKEPVALVIEEINRGNCAGIFGDLFQLLDREVSGISEFRINTTEEVKQLLSKIEVVSDPENLSLPPNLFLFATMNTSDQSLFPMDSAFKRRWNWEYVPINYEDAVNLIISIKGDDYSWKNFIEIINEKIYLITESDDKQLGNRFINPSNGIIKEKDFKGKVLFYLWNDIFKHEDSESDHNIFKYVYKEDGSSKQKYFKFSELYSSINKDTIIKGFFKFNNIELLHKDQNIVKLNSTDIGNDENSS